MTEQSYLVAARKYRPLLFRDVVAQEHVTETLKNAIRLDRLAHAYMFTGPRGVGKTTAARVLAKAINCTTPLDDREDRSEPCRTCASCKSFEEGRNLNIIEIDAASNNKVDDIRDLRDTVRIPPQGGSMKVYIVDEVHMLSTSAFNALLKTLEEPPPYVLFIFATTEPHKVLPTIQSRCQRFDFRRIAVPEIISRLKEICREEEISADESSLMLIARKGDGALRDALSVFDQAVSLCGTNLVYDEIITALGVVDADLYFEVTDAAASGDSARMIRIVEEIVRSGYDLQEFLDGLAEHLRNLLVLKTVGDPDLIEAVPDIRSRYVNEAGRFSESILLRLVHIVGETGDTLRSTRQPRLRLEMALLKMCSLPDALDLRSALEKLDHLERLVKKLPDQPAGPEKLQPRIETPKSASISRTGPSKTGVPTESGPGSVPLGADESEPAKGDAGRNAASRAEGRMEETHSDAASPSQPEPKEAANPSSHPGTPSEPDVAARRDTDTLRLPFDEPAIKRPLPRREDSSPVSDPTATATTNSEVAVLDGDGPAPEVIAAWDLVVAEMMEHQIRLGSLLRHTKVLTVQGETVLIGVPDSFHDRMLRNERHRLAQKLGERGVAGVKDIHFHVTDALAHLLADPNDETSDARASLKKKCEENPAVASLVERFGGEIVW